MLEELSAVLSDELSVLLEELLADELEELLADELEEVFADELEEVLAEELVDVVEELLSGVLDEELPFPLHAVSDAAIRTAVIPAVILFILFIFVPPFSLIKSFNKPIFPL